MVKFLSIFISLVVTCTLSLTFNSCVPLSITPTYVRQNVGNFDVTKTNLKDIINIDGYYVHAELEDKDSSFTYFMFFEDGMVNMRVHDYNVFPSGKDENISQFINQVVSNEQGKQAQMFYNSLGWGKYIIADDTIKVNYHSGWGYPDCYAFEIWFKVIDRTHLTDIYFSRITAKTPLMTEYQKKEDIYENDSPSRFIPLEKMPSSDCWLKKEKWFWHSEDKYNEYMLHIKK
jgi:hypothetical protein